MLPSVPPRPTRLASPALTFESLARVTERRGCADQYSERVLAHSEAFLQDQTKPRIVRPKGEVFLV